jgi:hypothetical protein
MRLKEIKIINAVVGSCTIIVFLICIAIFIFSLLAESITIESQKCSIICSAEFFFRKYAKTEYEQFS